MSDLTPKPGRLTAHMSTSVSSASLPHLDVSRPKPRSNAIPVIEKGDRIAHGGADALFSRNGGVSFRRDSKDRRPGTPLPPSMMGEPEPGRPKADQLGHHRAQSFTFGERITTTSGPVLLTFAEYARHYGHPCSLSPERPLVP